MSDKNNQAKPAKSMFGRPLGFQPALLKSRPVVGKAQSQGGFNPSTFKKTQHKG